MGVNTNKANMNKAVRSFLKSASFRRTICQIRAKQRYEYYEYGRKIVRVK